MLALGVASAAVALNPVAGQQPSLNLGAGEEEPSTRSPPPGRARARRSPWAWRRSAWACEDADGGGLERLAGGGGGGRGGDGD